MKGLIKGIVLVLFAAQGFSQPNRPQEPKPPYNYVSEDVTFVNSVADNIKLAGTLTLPKDVKNPAVAILISGSGAQNRNEEVAGHKPFLVLSDYLTNNGIAVLRYDDRGIADSEGDFRAATSFDFATDVEAAINYLKTRKEIDISKIGLIGHSEGGLIAPIVASQNKDVAFIVLLAGTGADGSTVLLSQQKRNYELFGASDEDIATNQELKKAIHNIIKQNSDFETIKTKIIAYLNKYKVYNLDSEYAKSLTQESMTQFADTYKSEWFRTFIRTNPQKYLSKTNCPVLAINGSKDVQVLSKLNLEGIESSLKKANNTDVTIKEIENLNHLFQTAETGSLQEYPIIEETFSPDVLLLIKDWISKRF